MERLSHSNLLRNLNQFKVTCSNMGSIFHLLIVLVTGLAASTLVFRLQYSDSATNPQVLYRTEKHGQEWQPIHHLGGNEPWFSKKADIVAPGTDVLPGCRVDQVHMVGFLD